MGLKNNLRRWLIGKIADLTFLEIVSNVIERKVVSCILKVNKNEPSVVLSYQNIVAEQIVVGKDELPLRLTLFH